MSSVIEVQQLSKKFGRFQALESLSFQVESGDFYGFIGPNGAGKSTTIRILLGLINHTSGSVKVFGQNVKANQNDILRRIGYVASEVSYYHGMTAIETIEMAAKVHGQVDLKEIDRLCKLFDVQKDKKVQDLSFGNRRKISIVTALQHQPELIILDEPTSGLDPLIQKNFWDEIVARNEAGTTVFISSHNLAEVQKYCRNAAIIRNGQLIEEGSMTELVQNTAKRVTIHGIDQLPPIEGDVKDLTIYDNSVSFLYQGSMEAFIEGIYPYHDQIADLDIGDPELEEVFLHYYNLEGEMTDDRLQ